MPSFMTQPLFNQVPFLEDYALFDTDTALSEAAAHGVGPSRNQTLAPMRR